MVSAPTARRSRAVPAAAREAASQWVKPLVPQQTASRPLAAISSSSTPGMAPHHLRAAHRRPPGGAPAGRGRGSSDGCPRRNPAEESRLRRRAAPPGTPPDARPAAGIREPPADSRAARCGSTRRRGVSRCLTPRALKAAALAVRQGVERLLVAAPQQVVSAAALLGASTGSMPSRLSSAYRRRRRSRSAGCPTGARRARRRVAGSRQRDRSRPPRRPADRRRANRGGAPVLRRRQPAGRPRAARRRGAALGPVARQLARAQAADEVDKAHPLRTADLAQPQVRQRSTAVRPPLVASSTDRGWRPGGWPRTAEGRRFEADQRAEGAALAALETDGGSGGRDAGCRESPSSASSLPARRCSPGSVQAAAMIRRQARRDGVVIRVAGPVVGDPGRVEAHQVRGGCGRSATCWAPILAPSAVAAVAGLAAGDHQDPLGTRGGRFRAAVPASSAPAQRMLTISTRRPIEMLSRDLRSG